MSGFYDLIDIIMMILVFFNRKITFSIEISISGKEFLFRI